MPEDLHLDILVTEHLMGDMGDEVEDVASVLNTLEELESGEQRKRVINYFRWKKETVKGKHGQRDQWVRAKETSTLGEAAALMVSDFHDLCAHLARNKELKRLIRERRDEVLQTPGHAMCHVDWAEDYKVKVNLI